MPTPLDIYAITLVSIIDIGLIPCFVGVLECSVYVLVYMFMVCCCLCGETKSTCLPCL